MDRSFPEGITWLPIEGPTSAYSISWERELARIFQIHPDWQIMLHAIDHRTLMPERRWFEILMGDSVVKRRLGAKWS